jgi:hypothetical protein
MSESFVPRVEPRYRVCTHSEVPAVVEWNEDGETIQAAGGFRDLSQHGARLTVSAKPPTQEGVTVRLAMAELQLNLAVDGEVCWTEPAGEAGWTFGCKLTGGIPDDVLQALASEGYVDRRQDRRQGVSIQATARWELASAGDVPVRVHNFSEGGIRVFSSEPGHPGGRLLLTLDPEDGEPMVVSAKAVWQLETEDGYHIGCSYADRSAFVALQERFGPQQQPVIANGRTPALRLNPVGWIGLLAIVIWAGWQFWPR